MQISGSYADVALAAWERHLATNSLNHYAGILSLQALARLARVTGSVEILAEARKYIRPFWQGEVEKADGEYGDTVYRWGGNATAFMVARGLLPEAFEPMVKAAEGLCAHQPRDSHGAFRHSGTKFSGERKDFIWIDTVFGVCPFLLWAGIAAQRQDFVDESCLQMLKHHEILFNKSRGLYHQAVNFNESGGLTSSFWSRGCGWAALTLAEMVYDVPKDHKDYRLVLSAWRELLCGCLRHMDEDGMLHQVVEDQSTYVETSGTAMVLYAMGRVLKNKSLDPDQFREPFLRGLRSMLCYVALDGSVFNCCPGCLSPGNGAVADYAAREWVLNDIHAFGPVMMLFGQAEQLVNSGIIPPLEDLETADSRKANP